MVRGTTLIRKTKSSPLVQVRANADTLSPLTGAAGPAYSLFRWAARGAIRHGLWTGHLTSGSLRTPAR